VIHGKLHETLLRTRVLGVSVFVSFANEKCLVLICTPEFQFVLYWLIVRMCILYVC
jgi:hypothetical protein